LLDSLLQETPPPQQLKMAELLSKGVLLGMGNPLLDISASVKPELLKKHGWKANDAILTEEETVFEELKEYKVEHIAGGATQNSIRVAQWLLGGQANPELCSYMGCVGKDDSSKILADKARECGVKVCYQQSDKPTGRCAVLITGTERSLVTKLDAANLFTEDHLQVEGNWALVKSAKTIYSAGFFLTVSTPSSESCKALRGSWENLLPQPLRPLPLPVLQGPDVISAAIH
jgi:adenosine kinase